MKKLCIIILLLLALSCTTRLQTQKIAELLEVQDPYSVFVDNNELFLLDRFTVHVYSIEPFSLKYRFGKKGKGPGDFKYKPEIKLTPNFIAGLDFMKTIWFSRKGEFLKVKHYEDFKDFNPGMEMILVPVKENYIRIICDHDLRKRYVYLVDPKFEPIKELHEGTYDWGTGEDIYAFRYRIHVECYDEKIFISDSERGFFINVFDYQGNHLWIIDKNKEIEKIKLSESDKKKIIEEKLLTRPNWTYDQVKDRIKFYNPIPLIDHFIISDGKIYVTTNKKIENKHEIFILDLKGNIIKKIFLPLKSKKPQRGILRFDPYTIDQGKLYELIKSKETDNWELHITEIK